MSKNETWDLKISKDKTLLSLDVKNLWRFRDLLVLLVKRDFVVVYKQTILGPLWFFVQPVLTTIIYSFIFGQVASLSTDQLPQPLFYMAGVVIWGYFADCFISTSDTFVSNQDLFGKVYFPRLIVPISKIVSGLMKFGVQFVLFLLVLIFYIFKGFHFEWTFNLLYVPFFLLLMSIYGLGFGLIFSAATTKYRDLRFLIQFGIQLLQYASIIVPYSSIKNSFHKKILFYNPIVHVVEGFRLAFLGKGELTTYGLIYSVFIGVIALIIGVLVFNKTEKTFVDTV